MLILLLCLVFIRVPSSDSSPNFVFILTDDQDLTLQSMNYMKNATTLIANEGVTLGNFFINSPVCCPSRSSILTGKLPHNVKVFNNSIEGGCSSPHWQSQQENATIASILKSVQNYTTFYAGKYLNQYGTKAAGGTTHVPPGYDWWLGLQGNSKYYNYILSINGSRHHYQNEYLTDLITLRALDFLNQKSVSGTNFFMMLAPPACHAPFTPAPRHRNLFPQLQAPRNLPFNATPINKHWLVDMPPTHLPSDVGVLDAIYRDRIRTLQSVDDMIGQIVAKLENIGVINNTYIILTSDNGYHIGQFTQPWDKRQPYESDIRTPFLIRGPKVPRKALLDYPVSGVDIAPTILGLANIAMPTADGVSFKEQLFNPGGDYDGRCILIEYWGEGDAQTVDPRCPWKGDANLAECTLESWCKCQDAKNNTYTCVLDVGNDTNFKLCTFVGGYIEAYDLLVDPHELNNLNHTQGQLDQYLKIIHQLKRCEGGNCQINTNKS